MTSNSVRLRHKIVGAVYRACQKIGELMCKVM